MIIAFEGKEKKNNAGPHPQKGGCQEGRIRTKIRFIISRKKQQWGILIL